MASTDPLHAAIKAASAHSIRVIRCNDTGFATATWIIPDVFLFIMWTSLALEYEFSVPQGAQVFMRGCVWFCDLR